MTNQQNGSEGKQSEGLTKGISMGAGIGMIFGAALGNPGVGLVLGAALGLALGPRLLGKTRR